MLQIMGEHPRSCGTIGKKFVRTTNSRITVVTKTRSFVGRRMGQTTAVGVLIHSLQTGFWLTINDFGNCNTMEC